MASAGTSPLLDARNLSYSRDDQRILSGIDLRVHLGERVAITGPSGSGKSSLLSIVAGLVIPDTGEVRINEQILTGIAGPALGVSLILQGYGLVSLLTANENVEIALRAAGRSPVDASSAARDALNQVGLGDYGDHLIEELSGGQQQRTAVARALALRPRLLIADEPTTELDRPTRTLVLARLLEISEHGGGLLLATHDPDVAERCDRVVDLRLQTTLVPDFLPVGEPKIIE